MFNLYSAVVCYALLPWVSLTTRSSFWPLHKQIKRRHLRPSLQPTSDDTLARLRELVTHAYQSVPFYRSRLDALHLAPESLDTLEAFRQLPPTTKSDVAANFPDGLLSSRQEHGPWRYMATSGTVERITIIQDFRKRDYARAATLVSLNAAARYRPGMRYMEIPPDVCMNVCGVGESVEPSLWRYAVKSTLDGTLLQSETTSDLRGMLERQVMFRRLELPSFGGDAWGRAAEALDDYLRAIDRYQPHVLKALPAYLYLLAVRIQEGGRKPRVHSAIMPMGSSMSPHMRRVVQDAFECPVHEDYGCAEAGAMAAECGHQNGLHSFNELFYVEVVRGGRPARPGEVGKVLITDLSNRAMPLIRYEIGDVATLHGGGCACGLPGDRLEVQGRVDDCLVTDDGELVTADTVVDALLDVPGVLGFQIDERPDRELHVRVVPRRDHPPSLHDVRNRLATVVGPSRRIVTRHARTILPERGGKYRFVRNLTNAPSQLLD
jgi:phenylacetate-CoA ligase